MIEIEVNRENLEKFIKNIRKQDEQELIYVFKKNYKEIFIKTCLEEKHIWFLADDNKNPLAIGGIQYYFNKEYKVKEGKIWLLGSNDFKKDSKKILKYVKNKIVSFKKDTSFLYNYIYKTNFYFLKWLKTLGFKSLAINDDTKLFYYTKEDNFDTRYIACK